MQFYALTNSSMRIDVCNIVSYKPRATATATTACTSALTVRITTIFRRETLVKVLRVIQNDSSLRRHLQITTRQKLLLVKTKLHYHTTKNSKYNTIKCYIYLTEENVWSMQWNINTKNVISTMYISCFSLISLTAVSSC